MEDKAQYTPTNNDLREALAAYAHEAWGKWMEYLFSKCERDIYGKVVIPDWAIKRWTRQMVTRYAELPDDEKKSDRAEADKMLAIVEQLRMDDVRRSIASADLAAKLQPITAEALLANGWKWDSQDREYTLTIPQKWTFFYNVEYSVLQVHCWDTESSVTVRTMSNMHDLRELVRLLGGAK